MERKFSPAYFLVIAFALAIAVTPATATDCNCSTCDDCELKLSNNSCSVVGLTANITDYDGTCINNPANLTNKILDCQGYAIDGDDFGTDYGFYVSGKSNNTLRNCVITDFYYGFYLYGSSNSTITNNTANSNTYGFYLSSSSNNNTIANNTANSNNYYGFLLHFYSDNNTLTNNTANSNIWNGIFLHSSRGNTLTNSIANSNMDDGIAVGDSAHRNTIANNTANSNDYGISVYGSSDNNTITNNTANSNTWGGILLDASWGNNLTNNIADSNNYGFLLYSSSNYTLINNTANSNTYYGFYFGSSLRNTLINNTINSNTEGGIYLSSSNSNIITSNTINSNKYGIRFYSSSNNNLTGNTADSNYYGIYSYGSSNSLNSNTLCANTNYDFYSSDWLSSSGDDNTCNISGSWNDAGTTGCTYACPGNYTTTTVTTTTITSTTSTTSTTTTTTSTTTTSTTTTSITSTTTIPEETTTSTTSTTPTTTTTTSTTTLPDVVINEFLPYPRGNNPEWIELYNKENSSVNLSGWQLDDVADGGTSPYTIPNGSVIDANGFLVFYASSTGIVLGDMGDTVRLLHTDGQAVDNYTYYYSQKSVSIGRLTDGGSEWTNFDVPTPGTSNEGILNDTTPPVVTLNSPPNDSINLDGNVIFRYTPQDCSPIQNCILYTNVTGTWQITQLDTSILVNYPNSFGLFGLSNGTYRWNVQCTDDMSLSAFAPHNYTFLVNTTTNETDGISINATVDQIVNVTPNTSRHLRLEINVTENISNVNLIISSFYNNTHNASLSVPGLGKYVSIQSSSELEDFLNLITIKMYYTEPELTANNLTEDDLGIWWFNETENEWQILNPDTMDWVRATGVNRGEDYVWANVEHLSDYTVAQAVTQTIPLQAGWNLISIPLSL